MSRSPRGAIERPVLACLATGLLAVVAASSLSGCGGGDASVADAGRAKPLGASAPQFAASAVFVSPTGSDSADGTRDHPWRTLTHAVSTLKAGYTLYAEGGTYAETLTVWRAGTAALPITITAYPGQHPVIDAASLSVPSWSGLLQVYGNYVTVSGFELRNMNVDGHGGLGGAAVVQGGFGAVVYGANDTIASMTIHDTWAQGILVQGDAGTVTDTVVHDVALSNCRTAGRANCMPASTVASGWPSCVSIASPFGSGHVTHGGTIQRTTVYDCWGEGVSTWLSDGMTIQDNTTYDNWAENLYVDNATNVLVQRNLVYNTPGNLVGKKSGFALADEYTNTSASQPNPLSSRVVVIDNLVYNASFSAYNWTLVGGSGLVDDVIANNTFVDTDPTTQAFMTGGPANTVPVANVGSTIANNIIIGANTLPSSAGIAFSHNLWTAAPGAGAGPGDVLIANGAAVIAQGGAPQPGALAASWFWLTPMSPAHVAGVPVPQVTSTYDGSPVQSPPDIGAF